MHLYIDQDTGEWVLELNDPGKPDHPDRNQTGDGRCLDYMDNVGVEMESEVAASGTIQDCCG